MTISALDDPRGERPLGDALKPLVILIWSLPVLWALGGERLLFPVLAVVLLIPRIKKMGTRSLSMIAPLWWCAAFLFCSLISVAQINTDSRIITFVWDFSIYLGFFASMLFITKNVTEFVQIERILFHLVLFSVVTQLVGLTYFFFGSWRYNSLIGQLLPSGLQETMVGRGVLLRAVGRELYLLGFHDRVKSIFLSSIHFGTVMMMTVSMAMCFFATSRGIRRWLFALLIVSSCLFLFFSQSRTAMVLVSAAIPGTWLTLYLSKMRSFGPFMLAIAGLCILIFLGILSVILWDDIWAFIQEVFIESRSGSFENRSEIYSQTIQWILQDPILGQGTQVDVPGLSYPLGSHNWYLSVLFKHGLIAFVPFATFLLAVLGCAIGNVFRIFPERRMRTMAICLGIWFIFYLLLCLTIEPVVDAIHLFYTGCLIGIILTLPNFARESLAKAREANFRRGPARHQQLLEAEGFSPRL